MYNERERMEDSNITDPIIPPMQSDPGLRDYRCPHCGKFLFKGNVKILNMVCHYCQKMISAAGQDLVDPEK